MQLILIIMLMHWRTKPNNSIYKETVEPRAQAWPIWTILQNIASVLLLEVICKYTKSCRSYVSVVDRITKRHMTIKMFVLQQTGLTNTLNIWVGEGVGKGELQYVLYVWIPGLGGTVGGTGLDEACWKLFSPFSLSDWIKAVNRNPKELRFNVKDEKVTK